MAWWRRWVGGRESPDEKARLEWRAAWSTAAADPHSADVNALDVALRALHLPDDEIELEQEMLDGLRASAELSVAVASGALPHIESGHRVIGSEHCHFTAPVSVPDEPSQPSGRLLFTGSRAVFIGGRPTTIPWHACAGVQQVQRDLVFYRRDRSSVLRFRCNSYTDALTGAVLARRLMTPARPL